MTKAKIFWSGRSQAVRAEGVSLSGEEVTVSRRGGAVVLEPVADGWEWLDSIGEKLDSDFAQAVKESRRRRTTGDRKAFPLMHWLLDANAVIAMLNDPQGGVARRARHPADVGVSVLIIHELYDGAFFSARAAQNAAVVDALCFTVLPFEKEDARSAGEIRAHLRRKGTPIGPYDVLIAGQAVARKLVLITHNRREFTRVPGPRTEDWEH